MITILMILGVVVILISVGFLAVMFIKSNEVNLTAGSDQKPAWMRSTPPAETVAVTQQQGMQLYGQEAGEHLASPFAEQIEDILRARLEADSSLSKFKVDLGSSENDGLAFWVNGEKYAGIDELPDENLKKAVREAVKSWEEQK